MIRSYLWIASLISSLVINFCLWYSCISRSFSSCVAALLACLLYSFLLLIPVLMLFVIHIGSVSWSCCEILFLYVLIRYFCASSCMIVSSLLMSHIVSGVCVSLLSIAAMYFSQCSSLVLKTVFSVGVLLWRFALLHIYFKENLY